MARPMEVIVLWWLRAKGNWSLGQYPERHEWNGTCDQTRHPRSATGWTVVLP
jgi:hypothetical protein